MTTLTSLNETVTVRGLGSHARVVDRADAAWWLLRVAVPDLLGLVPAEISRKKASAEAATILRSDGRLRLQSLQLDGCPEDVLKQLRSARKEIAADADRLSDSLAVLHGRGSRFLQEYGSLRNLLEVEFPALLGAADAARDLPGVADVAIPAYRCAVLAICRSLLFAQLCGDHRVIPAQVLASYRRSLSALSALAEGCA